MTLIQDIQAATISQTTDVPTLLRMCKLLAARISQPLLNEWVDKELNGYPDVESLPDYRVVRVDSYGSFQGGLRQANRLQIPVSILPEKLQEKFSHAYMTSGISAYAALLAGDTTGRVTEQWPLELALHYASTLTPGMQCVAAWKEIPIGAVVRLLDSVKTRILDYAIDLEREAPNAGETPIGGQPPLSSEKMTQIFNNTINGNVGNISNSGENFTQNASIQLGNWDSLTKQLTSLGLKPADFEGMQGDLDEANTAIDEKEKSSRASKWISHLTMKALEGASGVGIETAAAGVAKAIAAYMGLS
ncbi:AbiTii domain-containing protein [Pseudomonas serbica]